MIKTQQFAEMNRLVPGNDPFSPVSVDLLGECEVPSPSQWSDACKSPPSLHSPPHFPAEGEKLKEEPYPPLTPPSSIYSVASPVSQYGQLSPHSPFSPPARPCVTYKKEGYEPSINLAELLSEQHTLASAVQQHHQGSAHYYYRSVPLERKFSSREENLLRYQGSQVMPIHIDLETMRFSQGDFDFINSVVVKKEVEDYLEEDRTGGMIQPVQPFSMEPSPRGVQVQQTQMTPAASACDMLNLALEDARRDVLHISETLRIPQDPAQWTVENVRTWVKLQIEQVGAASPHTPLEYWYLTGKELLGLTEGQFRSLMPMGGENVYAKLEIWRAALRSYPPALSQVLEGPQVMHQPLGHMPQQHQQVRQQLLHTAEQVHEQQQLLPPYQKHPLANSMNHVQQQPVTQQLQINVVAQQQEQRIQNMASGPAAPTSAQPSSVTSTPQHNSQIPSFLLEESCLNVESLLQMDAGSGSKSSPSDSSLQAPEQSPPKIEPLVQESMESDDDATEEEPCAGAAGGRGGTHIHLWQFLKELLQRPQSYGSCIRWLDRQKGVFKIEDSVRVATLWGKRKNRPAMNYDKLSRSIRQYYKKGIMKKTERSQRLVYQFCHPYCL